MKPNEVTKHLGKPIDIEEEEVAKFNCVKTRSGATIREISSDIWHDTIWTIKVAQNKYLV